MTNAQKAQQFYNEAKRHLMMLAGVNGSRPQRGYFPGRGSTAGGMAPDNQMRPGTFNVKFGQAPSDADVQAFIRSMGGNPYANGAQGRSPERSNSTPSAGGTAPAPAGGESIRALIERLAGDYKAQQDAANAANEARYQEVKGSNADLYNRVMGEVDNWGGVQSQLNQEKAKESINNIRANLASRGLTDSTIGEAFAARNARDLALTQQDLSERKSDRRVGYDVNLTNNANNFIERRTDKGPDNSALLALSSRLGEAEAYQKGMQQAAAMNRQSRPEQQQPQYMGGGGVSPEYASMLATQMQNNFMGQLGGAMGQMIPYMGGPAYSSSSYPVKRTPEEYAAMRARQPNYQSKNGGITSNSHPVGMAANMAGLAYNSWPGMQKKVGTAIADFGEGLWNASSALDGYANKIDPWAQDPNAAGAKKVMGGINALGDAAFNAGEWLYYR